VTTSAADTVRRFILERVEPELAADGLTSRETPDDYDLLAEGVIDSFGIVDLIGALEERFDVRLDFEGVDPDEITVIGPLSAYVASLIEHQR
jgi:acyl carrier protein